MIGPFRDQYRFLSNFWPATVKLEGEEYCTVEHAYQAAKFADPRIQRRFNATITPGQAKRLSRSFPVRPDWEAVKLGIMYDLVWQKFANHRELRFKLLQTLDEELVEINTWNDRFWGVCNGEGDNHLGRILMQVRYELG